jgi:uncharacterized protein (TIGR00297 family)/Raf kinase inhibitor-like YbhB/YbcL family protein
MPFSPLQFALGVLLAVLISFAAYRLHSLSRSGALAATLLGAVIFGLGGLGWAVLLLAFFISSSGLSRLAGRRKSAFTEKFAKGHRRDAGQVLANGGIAGLFTLLHLLFPGATWPWAGAAGALAAANADTWATELGVLARRAPRLITTWKPVEQGTSGAISATGTLAGAGGALLIALCAALFWPAGLTGPARWLGALALVTAAGLLGSLVDSLLGATLQAIYHCPACAKETERHPTHTCGTPTRRVRGLPWLNNDAVNAACTLTGGLVAALAAGLLLAPVPATPPGAAIPLEVKIPGLDANSLLPVEFTCDGPDRSPALAWSAPPPGARSLALVVDDPDAPFGTFTHWVFYNLSPDLREIPPATPTESLLGTQGPNDFGRPGYNGPCPPPGAPHRYVFHLYALDRPPDLPAGLSKADLLAALDGHILAYGQFVATYARP